VRLNFPSYIYNVSKKSFLNYSEDQTITIDDKIDEDSNISDYYPKP